jgi:small subunit ribosomal protein S3
MSHKVHPYSFRLGGVRDWKSRWFGQHVAYRNFLKTDITLREFLKKKLKGSYVDGVEMERGQNLYRVVIKTSRPGLIIGKNGEGVAKLKEAIVENMKKVGVPIPKEVRVDVEEVRNPDIHSALVAQMIAEGLEKRLPFLRVMKQSIEKVMASKEAIGVRVTLSGRLGGSEMGRRESLKKGRLPLQTIRADIDFARERASLPYGDIGIKVWIYRGDVFEQAKKKE